MEGIASDLDAAIQARYRGRWDTLKDVQRNACVWARLKSGATYQQLDREGLTGKEVVENNDDVLL